MEKVRKTVLWIMLFLLSNLFIRPPSVLGITIKEEEELSKEFQIVIREYFHVIDDPLLVMYLNRVGNRVLSGFSPQPFPYHFNVIRQDVYNAFAGPGGYVYINSGLFAALDNEDELAGILAHEISHVSRRHLSAKIEQSSKIGMATLAGIVAGIFLGIGGGGEIASALTIGSMAAGQSMLLAYSRDDERDADKIALPKLYQAGYTGDGLLTSLKKIRAQQWYGTDEVPSYITTHPAVEERMGYIENWITANASGTERKQKDDLDFLRMRTRIVALYTDQKQALRKFEAETKENPRDFLAHYGYALALARSENRKEAISEFKKALEIRAFDPYVPGDLGEVYFLSGDYEAAYSVLSGADETVPDPGRAFYLGRIQLERGQIQTARDTFQQLVTNYPGFTEALYYLGEAYGKLDDMGEAHFYLGLYYKDRGDVMKAVFHLERALDMARGDEKKEKIITLLKPLSKKKYEKERAKKQKEQEEIEQRQREEEYRRRRWYERK